MCHAQVVTPILASFMGPDVIAGAIFLVPDGCGVVAGAWAILAVREEQRIYWYTSKL